MSVYDRIGGTYSATRRPDPRIERQIAEALGDARSVVRLERDLADGTWAERNADLIADDEADLGYRLLVANAP